MPHRLLALSAVPLSAILLALPIAGQTTVLQAERGPYRVVTVADGLQSPWSIAFLPGGEMLVTERPGRLRVVRNGALQPEPISGIPAVRFAGQGGLMEVTPHPQFAANRLLYLSYSKPNADGTQGTTAIIRGRLDGNALVDVEEIFEARAWSTTNGHYGSRLAFDRDGYLFITIGDRQAPAQGVLEDHPAQDLSNHQGTVVRLHDDGRVPADNPFVGREGALPEIWSYGHRSPQGLVIHPETGDVWLTEHGPQGGDELNLVQPGKNYGWPVIGYGVLYGGGGLHIQTHREGMEQPIQFWTPSIATSGLALYTGDRFPEWRGDLFVGGLAGQQLARLPLVGDERRQVGRMERPPLMQSFGRIRDVRTGPDGYIYLAIENRTGPSQIVRLEPGSES
jgi:aldose sugar dehydrogenase